jgi:hypothetical protein
LLAFICIGVLVIFDASGPQEPTNITQLVYNVTMHRAEVLPILYALRFGGLMPTTLALFLFTFMRSYDMYLTRENTLTGLALAFSVCLLLYEYYLLAFVRSLSYGIPLLYVGFLHVFMPIKFWKILTISTLMLAGNFALMLYAFIEVRKHNYTRNECGGSTVFGVFAQMISLVLFRTPCSH